MPSGSRRDELARYAAPAAFLAAATVAVLLVRAGLSGGEPERTGTTATRPTATMPADTSPTVLPGARRRVTTSPAATEPPRRYYVLRRGDTLAGVAAMFDTTVEQLRVLNPGVAPTALRVGQRLRVS